MMSGEVRIRREPIVLPTYEPAQPDPNPMFLEKRVYQGSSGRVYPLPFTDRVAETPTDREWDAIYLDNGWVEVMLLPEIGGRIHAARDLTNGYDFIYRQPVIKPALVGLAGPWVSGGVEFNWPQHHRPSTFMPTDVEIEHGEDGSITVWMSEHEPLNRMKGMHGVCLHPDRSVVEIKVRLYNRTPYAQTFLWWANIGTKVHQGYRSFFPPDVDTVADHAKRALSHYPLCEGRYYGVDYGRRAKDGVPADERPTCFVPANCGGEGPEYPPNDLAWYANIPVPTSYMCLGSMEDFFGGYDLCAKAGLIHIADHHISPGKKQWTWGNHEFGYAWDRNLTDGGGPYIELMAGVYTDNQPDFAFLAPGETKSFSQYLYPFREIGVPKFANLDAAISVETEEIGVAVTRSVKGKVIVMGTESGEWDVELSPDQPFRQPIRGATRVVVMEGDIEIARYEVKEMEVHSFIAMTEPPLPADIATNEELYLTGLHLEQYRHATRSAADYWLEGLRRDPGDTRCNNAQGLWHLRRGEFALARRYFEAAITRATMLNPNPYDGEPYYNLGLALRFLGRDAEAVDAFAKATWNAAWQAPGYHALGEMACRRQEWSKALEHLDHSIRKDADNFRARCLRAMVVRKLGRQESVDDLLSLDPLDYWARWLSSEKISCDNGVRLDLTVDLLRAGLAEEALAILEGADPNAIDGTAPMVAYYEAYIKSLRGGDAREAFARAMKANPNYCFPARLEDITVLEAAPHDDPRAALYLGNLFYDRKRYDEAIALWQKSIHLDPSNSVAHRNLAIGAYNRFGDAELARKEYDAAIAVAPDDARLWYERDQLWKRLHIAPDVRYIELQKRSDMVAKRDDLTIEFCNLLDAVGKPEDAAKIMDNRRFQPWEGGEGLALGVFTRTHLVLGRKALASGDAISALRHFELTVRPPHSLGEARHLLANASHAWLALGDAFAALGSDAEAKRWWDRAASFAGDFQEMSERKFSAMTYYQALALERLGREAEARQALSELKSYAEGLLEAQAKPGHFTTSMPSMLLFDDDPQTQQANSARILLAQAAAGLGNRDEAMRFVTEVLSTDPTNGLAKDLQSAVG